MKTVSIEDIDEDTPDHHKAETLADLGVSMALDNGSDMKGEDPYEHAEEHWKEYIHHAVEMYQDVANHAVSDESCDRLHSMACLVAPKVWEGDLTLQSPIEEILTDYQKGILMSVISTRLDEEISSSETDEYSTVKCIRDFISTL